MATRGAYQTKQREAVIRLFRQRPESCLTAQEAYEALEGQGAAIGKTTVYRVITRLWEDGALRRYAPHERGEAARFQLNPCKESHLHLRCVECGAMSHLRCEEAEAFREHLTKRHGFCLDEGQTLLYGRCQSCQEKNERNEERHEGQV